MSADVRDKLDFQEKTISMNMPDIVPKKWYWRLTTVLTGTVVIASISYIFTNSPSPVVGWKMIFQFPIMAFVWMPWLVLPLVYFGIINAVAILTIITESEAKSMRAEQVQMIKNLESRMGKNID